MLFIINNPAAGAGKSASKVSRFCNLLEQAQLDYELHNSKSVEECQELVRLAIDKQVCGIALAGGDGTLRAIVNVLVGSEVPLLILPFGSGNDFARKLGQSGDPEQLFEIWQRKKIQVVDAVKGNEHYFLNVAGQGFDVDVLKQAEHFKKRFGNQISYLLGLFVAIIHLRGHEVTVKSEQVTKKFKKTLLASVGNGTYIGGGMAAHPLAEISDGFLEVCIINNVKLYRIPLVLLKFLKGKHLSLPETTYYRVKEVICETQKSLPVEFDGDIVEMTPVKYEVIPNALNLIV